MRTIAIIPARAGSKRIKKKNIRLFHGKPIIEWVIDAALRSNLFEKVIVSTDSEEIANLSNSAGAETPFRRPKKLSGDDIGLRDVVNHAIYEIEKGKTNFDKVTMLYATAPFVSCDSISKSLKAIKNYDFSVSVCAYSHPLERALKFSDDSQLLEMISKENYTSRSQDLGQYFHDIGQFVSGTKDAWKTKIPFVSGRTSGIVMPKFLSQDIDSEDDWIEAEIKFSVLKARGLLE